MIRAASPSVKLACLPFERREPSPLTAGSVRAEAATAGTSPKSAS